MPGEGGGPVSAQGELFNQLQQMQDQLSRQQGTIEELQNDVARMKQESLERYQDLDRRISSGAAPAATPENSSAGGARPAGAAAGAAAAAKHPPPAANRVIRRKKSSITMQPST
jgi:TolA-binding protein